MTRHPDHDPVPPEPADQRGPADERWPDDQPGAGDQPGPWDQRGPEDQPGAARPGEAVLVPDEESAYDLLQRGHVLIRDRHHAQAAIVLERAARLEPGKASILEALGRARYNAGQHEAAREAFEALVDVDPASHYGHFALGESLRKLQRTREAWTHLRVAVALCPSSALYRSALARLPEPDHAAERRAEEERRAASRHRAPGEPGPEDERRQG